VSVRIPPRPAQRRSRDSEAILTYACDMDGETPDCWLRQFTSTDCAGRMDRAHLIPKQTLKKAGLAEHILDPATWRPACRYHHFSFDAYRGVEVPRSSVPVETERFADRYGLGWYLTRRFGAREDVAA
jgi:hypothetical protein